MQKGLDSFLVDYKASEAGGGGANESEAGCATLTNKERRTSVEKADKLISSSELHLLIFIKPEFSITKRKHFGPTNIHKSISPQLDFCGPESWPQFHFTL